MKIYDFTPAPNCKRVRMFVLEKGLDIAFEQVDLLSGEHKSPDFLKKNPMGLVPVLELDDGTCIAESVAICRYLDDVFPEPPLTGTDPKERAVIEMWNRRVELGLFHSVGGYFVHTAPFFKDHVRQRADYAEDLRETARKQLQWLDQNLGDRRCIAGERYSIADITAQMVIDLGTPSVFTVDDSLANISRWLKEVSSRPGAAALAAKTPAADNAAQGA